MDINIGQIVVTALFALVGSFLGFVFTRLYDYIWKPFFVHHNMERLQKAMVHLEARCNDVKVQVSKAESERKICIHEVKWWLEMVKSIQEEKDIGIEYDNFQWRYSYIIFWKRYSIGYKVVTKYREVIKLLGQGAFKDVATELPPPAARVLPSTPRVQAMDFNQDQILRYLNREEVNIIGIWGMGGVGKTTLLKRINNYFAYNQLLSFDHVIFVVASKEVNMEELQKRILKDLRLPSSEKDDINSQATLLLDFQKNKKVLLLLDDLWEHVDLICLGIPLEHSKCRVVFTTRSLRVCRLMKAEKELKVECLNKKEAWSLFEENVGEDIIRADPNIGRLAEEVVKECCGLPLALITIGRAMSDKKTWREWQDVLNLLHSSRHDEISDIPDKMFPILEISYRNLQTDTMRECFLTCFMWPEDYDISDDDLIICWMGLGLIDDYNEINEAFDRGHSIIEILIGACLLERADGLNFAEYSCVKMHDVLRDLALWIASDHGHNKNKWMVQANIGLKDCKTEKWKGAHRISLMHNHIQSLPERLPKCPELSVLMLNDNPSIISIPRGFSHCFRSLTYLDLELCSMKKLPAEVGQLVNLKFLNLRNTRVEYLPCELANLMNLKYLLLGGVFLKVIPWEWIPRLSKLKVLDVCCQVVEIESQGAFEALKQLDGQLVGLSLSICTVLALEQFLNFSTISILQLRIDTLEGIESLELLSPGLFNSKATTNSLQSLEIFSCGNLKVLIVDSVYSQGIARPKTLPRLECVYLVGLIFLEKIVWRGVTPQEFLPSLHSLQILACHKLKDVSWVLQLPNLKGLQLYTCDELEMVIGDVGDGTSDFPKLRSLELQDLRNLGSICSTTIRFPSLESISVYNCPELKKLPFQAPNIPDKLQVIAGSRKWWEHLDWEDGNNTKSLLQNYFKAHDFR